MSANKYGPSRQELKFRLTICVVGLVALVAGLMYRGLPTGPGGWEAVILAVAFFGGSTIWILRKLILRDHPKEEV